MSGKKSIELVPSSSLPNTYVYKIFVIENEEIHKKIQDLVNKGHILPSSSPCGSPVILVPKKDGTWRMCIEYQALNKISMKNRYPLPRIYKLIDNMKCAKFFTKLNLKSGYHQISVDPIDVSKTALKKKEVLFEWLVIPFGLTNAPATFM